MVGGISQTDATKEIGVEPLLSVLLLQGLLPVDRRQLEHTAAGPARQQAQQVAQVTPGLDLVQAAARQERDEGRIDLAGVVAADKRPISSADDFPAQSIFAGIVVRGQPRIVEEARERRALVARVADG